ncbi:hypothetical protein Aab01nite_06000 [Paractinoplanes abujensis]|uniref:Uncharacterized protein n=1 Tax=Paractinoplanes abujensis TaxID=882441 RepID=A0A7W7G2D8_9ACTN|nr:hypothetical protein [Actinoplanes abujensis]MBB4691571.1 hypothetical protein [Actinoplanes abujensis]GID17010.1 hypothetical protein Aab01nite_06000 [Actinoplanes abujensis]
MHGNQQDPNEGAVMDFPRLVRTVPGAPWLPAGSTAEVWAGEDLDIPRPAVIVRLLLTRAPGEIFCVPTPRGPDLPTTVLGTVHRWQAGVAGLCRVHLGSEVATRCVGYVRNIVPEPDETYRLPVPDANVLVFTPRTEPPEPDGTLGAWVGRDEAPALLGQRHWWPIACVALGWTGQW